MELFQYLVVFVLPSEMQICADQMAESNLNHQQYRLTIVALALIHISLNVRKVEEKCLQVMLRILQKVIITLIAFHLLVGE